MSRGFSDTALTRSWSWFLHGSPRPLSSGKSLQMIVGRVAFGRMAGRARGLGRRRRKRQQMTGVILGAGYIGMTLARALADQGDEVYVVRRSPQRDLPGVRAVYGDLTRPDEITGLPEQIDHLVLCS